MRLFVYACCLITALFSVSLASAQPVSQGYIYRTLHQAVPGGIAVVPLGAGQPAPTAQLNGQRLLVVQDSDGQWVAIAGLDLKTPPGEIQITAEQGGQQRIYVLGVGSKKYRQQHIRLKNKQHVNPDPQQLKRFEREYQAQINAYANYREAGPSNVVLDAPVQGPLSGRFGVRRFFNGEERNPHSGLDFAVPSGTPVKAPADGVVTIVDDYFFNGKTVFIWSPCIAICRLPKSSLGRRLSGAR